MSCENTKCWFILGIVGVIVLLLGILLGFVVFPLVVRDQIAQQVALVKGSEAYDRWEVIPVPLYFNAYVFHVLNPDDVQNGAKPILQQVGPFVYKETRKRDNIVLDVEEDTATYNQNLTLEFMQEMSGNLTEDYEVTVLNIPQITLAYAGSSAAISDLDTFIPLMDSAFGKIWPGKKIFMTVKVGDLLFNQISIKCDWKPLGLNIDAWTVCQALGANLPKTVVKDDKNYKFSFFRYKIDLYDGLYKISTGIKDPVQIGSILAWDNVTSLDMWGGDTCNKIRGTDMTVFRPYLGEEGTEYLYIYNTDLCRVVKLKYTEESEYEGISAVRYTAVKANLLSSVLEEPENYCYCPRSLNGITKYGGCLKSGAMEMTPCQGSPVVLSYPHFFAADKSYQDGVIGLAPEEEKHRLFLDLEPNTGTPLKAASRVQINFPMRSMPKIAMMRNLPSVMLPIVWFDETLDLSQPYIDMLNSKLLNIVLALEIVKWALIGIGIALIVVSTIFYNISRKKLKRLKRERAGQENHRD